MKTAIEEFIVKHIVDRRGVPGEQLDRHADMFEQGYVDSLAVFNMMLLLEDQFDIRFAEEDVVDPSILTVSGLASVIEDKRRGSHG